MGELVNCLRSKQGCEILSGSCRSPPSLWVYAMGPRPTFSKRVLPRIKIMTVGRSVDVISGNSSWHFLVSECYFFYQLSFKWGPYQPSLLLKCCFPRYLINLSHHNMRHCKWRSNVKYFGGRTLVYEAVLCCSKYFTCCRFYSKLHKN